MRERDWEIVRARRAELEAAEAAERERIEAPIRAAEQKLQETHQQLIAIQRDNILKLKDEEFSCPPEVATIRMSLAEAEAQNLREINKFVAECDEYRELYQSPANGDVILEYLSRNGIRICTSELLNQAFEKLRDLHLLTEKERPAPEPINVSYTPVAPVAKKPETHEGFDLESGERRTFTNREVALMSADTFRRVFRIYAADLQIPRLGPGPRGLR